MPAKKAAVRHKPLISARERKSLLVLAKAATMRSYSPYSRFKVGAAVLTEAGSIYCGCNVENSSYGLTNCAERTAIFTAVATEGAKTRIRAIAVWSRPERPCSPCGACRQVILEFGPEAIVLFQGRDGIEELGASELLPAGFLF